MFFLTRSKLGGGGGGGGVFFKRVLGVTYVNLSNEPRAHKYEQWFGHLDVARHRAGGLTNSTFIV